MSLLNSASDGLFNIVIVLYKCLLKYNNMQKPDLIRLCSPYPDNESAADKINQSLNRWTGFGLFEEDKKKDIVIAEEYRPESDFTIEDQMAKLPGILRQIIFKKENNLNFWNTEKNKSADLTKALAWVLLQNPYTADWKNHSDVESLDNKQFIDVGKYFAFGNDVRWNTFRPWAEYLGFAWIEKINDVKIFQIDPSQAIKEEIRNIFGAKTELSSDEFLERLGSILPVLDGGVYREEVKKKMKQSGQRSGMYLSGALSRALIRLSNEKVISYKKKADSKNECYLVNKNNERLDNGTISHISYMEMENQ